MNKKKRSERSEAWKFSEIRTTQTDSTKLRSAHHRKLSRRRNATVPFDVMRESRTCFRSEKADMAGGLRLWMQAAQRKGSAFRIWMSIGLGYIYI